MLADTQKLRVNIQRVESQCLSSSEVLENLKQDDDDAKKSKQLKNRKIDFREASFKHSQKRRKDKDIKRCKKYRRIWKEALST